MIAESLLIIVLLSCGASDTDVDGTYHQYNAGDMEASSWVDHAFFPISIIPLFKSSEYSSGKISLINNYGASIRLNQIKSINAGIRNNALNFLSTRLIL